jgi:transposase
LITYRKKDSIEKIFHSLKNEIQIKPLRVWSEDSIYGAIILDLSLNLFISLMRYEFEELKHTSTKFIKKSLKNLTLTIKFRINGVKNYILRILTGSIANSSKMEWNYIEYVRNFYKMNELSSQIGTKKKGKK